MSAILGGAPKEDPAAARARRREAEIAERERLNEIQLGLADETRRRTVGALSRSNLTAGSSTPTLLRKRLGGAAA